MAQEIASAHAENEMASLVARLANIRTQDIPSSVLERAVLSIGDSIAVGLTTANEPEIVKFRDFALSRACRNECTIFSAPAVRADREWASVVNALSMTTAELDGGYDKTSCHAALYTVPALLAEAEASGISISELLRAEVLSYELITRIARAWAPTEGKFPPLYTHSRFCAIGAAAAAAFARNQGGESILRAINMAATLISVGPRNHLMEGALVRNVWPAAATWSGIMSVQWSECGFDGLGSSVHDVFTGVLGFPFNSANLAEGLGIDWAIMHGYVRMHACHLFFSTLVESLLEIRGQLVLSRLLEKIDSISIATHPETLQLVGKQPKTSLQGRFSIPHIAATTLVHGDALPASFSGNVLQNEPLATLRDRVRVIPFDMSMSQGHHWPAAVEVTAGGRVFRAVHLTAPGGHGEPYTKDDLLLKIRNITAQYYPRFFDVFLELVELNPGHLKTSAAETIRQAVTYTESAL